MLQSPISTLPMSPNVSALLTQITDVPDPQTALWKVLHEYVALKIEHLLQQISQFESKWDMTFSEFAERCENNTLGQDPFLYEVESDYWEWEAAETLLDHFRTVQQQWM